MSIIDTLLADVKEPERSELERIRRLVLAQCPVAEEVMTYGMPGFKYKTKYLVSFAYFKDHLSLFPGSEPIELLANELKQYKTSKGTIQFTCDHPLSDELVNDIISLCMQRIDAKAKN